MKSPLRDARILVVEDDRSTREALEDILAAKGCLVESTADGAEAQQILSKQSLDLVLTDLVVPGASGLEVLAKAQEVDRELPVVLMTGYGTIETAVEAMQAGAFHYLTKPVKPLELEALVVRGVEARRVREENRELKAQATAHSTLASLRGESPPMRKLRKLLERVGPSDSTVLITGASGTGKELVAEAIHQLSTRAEGPLVKVNCAALVESLLQSELFGHVKGAFTGAIENKKGRFLRAHRGTIFLDEIGEMAPETQARLLRVLQDGQVEPVGSDRSLEVDVRVVAATNLDLEAAMEAGDFRRDLYYRLKVIHLELPELRHRAGDIPLLTRTFLEELEERWGRGILGLEPEAMDALLAYSWPGNVRELKHCLEGAMVTTEGERIGLEDLPREVRRSARETRSFFLPPQMTLEEMEEAAIHQAMRDLEGVRQAVADRLGISTRTLQRKLKQYRLEGDAQDSTAEPC